MALRQTGSAPWVEGTTTHGGGRHWGRSSVPAGLLRMRFKSFLIASTIGTAGWTAILALAVLSHAMLDWLGTGEAGEPSGDVRCVARAITLCRGVGRGGGALAQGAGLLRGYPPPQRCPPPRRGDGQA